MSFTSQLGKVESQLGNIELGSLGDGVQHPSNALVLSQEVSAFFTNTRSTSLFQPFQTLTRTITLSKSVGNTLSLSQSAIGHNVRGAENTLTISQSVVVTKSKPAVNTLVLTQNVTILTSPLAFNLRHNLNLSQDVESVISKSYSTHNAIGFSQTLKQGKQYDLSVGNTYNPTSVLTRETFNRLVVSTLNLSQSVDKIKIVNKSVIQPLTLSQTVVHHNVIKRTLTNALIFLNNHEQYVPIGGLGNTLIDNLIVSKIETTETSSSFSFSQDSQGNRFIAVPQSTKSSLSMVLRVPERAITLPAPEWDDSEEYSGVFTIRRSMVGDTYTYVHRLNTDKLKYDLVFGTRKARELESYLLNYNSRVHTLVDWKGGVWFVFLTNNPFELVSGNRYSNGLGDNYDDLEKVRITLEFEGMRIN